MLKFWKKGLEDQDFLYEEKPVLEELDLKSENIKNQIGDSSDIVMREVLVNGNKDLPVTLFFVDGLVNGKNIDDDILKPLLQESSLTEDASEKEIIERVLHGGLYHNSAKLRDTIIETIEDILSGSAAIIFDEERKAITFDIKGFEKRSVSEPTGENVLKGSKDSFIEVLRVNTSLVRRKIKTSNLRIKQIKVGQQTLTDVAVVWIEGITNQNLIDDTFNRLNSIDTEGILTTASVEEYIIDSKWSVFPQILFTERTDKFCRNLLDGRIGIIIDGLPTTFIAPSTFDTFMEAPEDHSNNYIMATFLILLRYIAYFISLFLPGIYIAITSFSQEMLPTDIVISIAQSKEGVPFPTFVEIFGMLLAFELLIEAGLRLPKNIGQTVSIIGAVVVGQAAVEAKLVSPGVVIIVALTAICGFTMPNQDFSNSVRIWRFLMTIFASIGGLFGITIGLIIMMYKAAQIETFGVAFLTPFSANQGHGIIENSLIRLPAFMVKKRKRSLKTINKQRQK